MEFRITLAFFLLACGVRSCTAWGVTGHQMVCQVAQSQFADSTLQAVEEMLGPYASMDDYASLCLWADWVKRGQNGAPRYAWSSPLHYADSKCSVDTCFGGASGGSCEWQYNVDCPGKARRQGLDGMCVAGAINNYTRQIYTKFGPRDALVANEEEANMTEALLFLSHFLGDSHQPLHAGFETDKGGNDIDTTCDFCGVRKSKKANLHEVWDNEIIQRAIRTVYKTRDSMVDELVARLKGGGEYARETKAWVDCNWWGPPTCAAMFVEESETLACQKAYVDENESPILTGGEIDVEYYNDRLPIVEMRVAQAGFRLANFLNLLFANNNPAALAI